MVLRQSKHGPFYGCTGYPTCDATHGAHPDVKPLGIPADKPTKQARIRAHEAFDRLWKRGRRSRSQAYAWLREAMDLTEDEAHIGRFDMAQGEELIAKASNVKVGRKRRS